MGLRLESNSIKKPGSHKVVHEVNDLSLGCSSSEGENVAFNNMDAQGHQSCVAEMPSNEVVAGEVEQTVASTAQATAHNSDNDLLEIGNMAIGLVDMT